MKFISSISETDCLFTCLKIVLATLNNDDNFLLLSNPHIDKEFNFKEIVEIAEKYQVKMIGVEFDNLEDIANKKYPKIITLKNDEDNGRHAVILKKVSKKKIVVVDPSFGEIEFRKEEIIEKIDGYALLVDSYHKMKCPKKVKEITTKVDTIIISLLELFSGASCLLGTYFVSEKNPFYLPIIFFAFFFIFEIILRKYMVIALDKVDQLYLYKEIRGRDFYSYYEKHTLMKTNYFLSFVNALFSLIVIIFLATILIMNNLTNVIYVVLALTLSIIGYLSTYYIFNPLNNKINLKETKLKKVKNDEEFISLTKEINKLGYRYGLAMKLKSYVVVGVFLFTTILVMALSSKSINITYVVFNMAILIMLYQYMEKVFGCGKHYIQYLNGRNYINQFIK